MENGAEAAAGAQDADRTSGVGADLPHSDSVWMFRVNEYRCAAHLLADNREKSRRGARTRPAKGIVSPAVPRTFKPPPQGAAQLFSGDAASFSPPSLSFLPPSPRKFVSARVPAVYLGGGALCGVQRRCAVCCNGCVLVVAFQVCAGCAAAPTKATTTPCGTCPGSWPKLSLTTPPCYSTAHGSTTTVTCGNRSVFHHLLFFHPSLAELSAVTNGVKCRSPGCFILFVSPFSMWLRLSYWGFFKCRLKFKL